MMDWDALTIGDRLRPFPFTVDGAMIAAYRDAVQDHSADGSGERFAPPTLLSIPMLKAIDGTWAQRPGSVHAKQRFEFKRGVRADSSLTVHGRITQLYVRRGRRYIVVATEVVDGTATEVARGETVVLYPDAEAGERAE